MNVQALDDAVESARKLLELRRKQVELTAEMLKALMIAQAAGIDPKLIKRCAYRAPTRDEWRRWPLELQKRLPWSASIRSSAHEGEPGAVNLVVLKDGREIPLTEPIFDD